MSVEAPAPVKNEFSLVPIEPRPVKTVVRFQMAQLPELPNVVNRETVTHGLITLATLAGAGTLAVLEASTAGLAVMAAGVAASVIFSVSRFLGAGRAPAKLIAAVEGQRAALAETHRILGEQASAIASDRERLNRAEAEMEERIAGRVEQALQAERKRPRAPGTIAEELQALTANELKTLNEALTEYALLGDKLTPPVYYRFFGEAYPDAGPTTQAHHVVLPAAVLSTLLQTGKIVVGTSTLNSQQQWVGSTKNVKVLNSLTGLRAFLRAFLGKAV